MKKVLDFFIKDLCLTNITEDVLSTFVGLFAAVIGVCLYASDTINVFVLVIILLVCVWIAAKNFKTPLEADDVE